MEYLEYGLPNLINDNPRLTGVLLALMIVWLIRDSALACLKIREKWKTRKNNQ